MRTISPRLRGDLFAYNRAMRALALVLTVLAAQSAGAVEKCELVKKRYGPEGKAAVKLETVVAGLEGPGGIAFLPGGGALVTERPARLGPLPAPATRQA